MNRINYEELQQSILEIKLGFKNPAVIIQLREKYNEIFEGYIKTDKDNLIQALRWIKKNDLMKFASPRDVSNFGEHDEFTEKQPPNIVQFYDMIQSSGHLDETIPTYVLLNNTRALKLELIIPDLISYTFSVYEEIYKKSKVTAELIREYAEKTVHFSINELCSMLDNKEYNKIMTEGRRISNETLKIKEDIFKYDLDENSDELKALYEQYDNYITEGSKWQNTIFNFIAATGYKDLLHKHFEALGLEPGVSKFTPDEIYSSMDHLKAQSSPFVGLMQNKMTNEMNKVDLRAKNFEINQIDTGILKAGNLTFLVPDFKGADGLNVSNKLFLSFLYHELTLNGNNLKVMAPLEKYMEMKGNEITPSNKKQIRKNVLALMEPLKKLRFIQREKGRDSGEISLYGGTARVVRGYIEFRFNPDYFQLLKDARYTPMPIHVNVFKVDPQRRPHAYYIACKMAEHDYLSRENTFTLRTANIVNSCPELPSPESLSKGQKTERILEPFFKSLDHLKEIGVLESFDFILANGDISYPNTYEELMESKIKYEYSDPYPKKKAISKPKKKNDEEIENGK